VCVSACPPILWVNGKSKSKEVLLSDIIKNNNISSEKDYNEILSELAEDRKEKIARVLEIADPRKKLIMLAILAGYSTIEIAGYFKLTVRRIEQLSK
jgi:hypothetical protein